ncbi:hypothetical protein KUV57_11185 [Epibacterium sp. DP7N7-1]|nr:hypothetical protein [Epibacterium sp. DP7N7-1]
MMKIIGVCATLLSMTFAAQASSATPVTEDMLRAMLVPDGMLANWEFGTDGKLSWLTDVEISGEGIAFEARRITIAPSHGGATFPFQAEYLLFRKSGEDGITSRKDVRISGLAGVDVAAITSLIDGSWCNHEGRPVADVSMSFIDLTIMTGLDLESESYRLPGMTITPEGDQGCARAFSVSAPKVEIDGERVKINPTVETAGPILDWTVKAD